MAKQLAHIEPAHAAFIGRQHIFFTASAAATGRVNVFQCGTDVFRILDPNTAARTESPGARQVIHLEIDLMQTSCGYGVPLFDYKKKCPTLRRWADKNDEAGVAADCREKNVLALTDLRPASPQTSPFWRTDPP